MPGGRLPRKDTELVILRVAHNTGCEYEWSHHERIGGAPGSAPRRSIGSATAPTRRAGRRDVRILLSAVDELHREGEIGDALWERLSAELDEVELIELCMLVGHYEMLAMTLNTLRVEPEHPVERRGEGPPRPPLPDHRRRQRHRPGDGARRRRDGERCST